MLRILPRYIRSRFIGIFLYCLLSVIIIFTVVDLVENLDQFLDRDVPTRIVFLYYLYYTPYNIVLTLPVATLLASVFSIGTLARHNETIAMKALGYSLYRVIRTLLGMGLLISLFSFMLAEGVVIKANRRKEDIKDTYLRNRMSREYTRIRNIEIQEPPDRIITIKYFDAKRNIAYGVEIKRYRNNRLISRIDAPSMRWDKGEWVVSKGYRREFKDENEKASIIDSEERFDFHITPKELMQAQLKPDEMTVGELVDFIKKVKISGGEVHKWKTDLYLRFSYPLTNLIIVLFSVPLAYNRRRNSVAMGFGIALTVCFFYFGLVKMGQTIGHKGGMDPMCAAWLGNGIMGIGGVINLIKTRK